MAEETFHPMPWIVSQPRLRQASATSSSATEDKSASSKPSQRRRPSPPSKSSVSPLERPKGVSKRSSSSKSTSFGSRDGPPRPSIGTMNDPANEITYTPTTHRISKAKKGKKVHACEHPGCSKVCSLDRTQTPAR